MLLFIVFIIFFILSLGSIIRELIIGIIWSFKKRKKASVDKIALRFKKNTRFLVSSIILMVLTLGFSYITVNTPKIVDKKGKVLKNSIAELKKVNVNGRQEWISIRGENKNNPVILFLAGGPGGTQMSSVRYNLKKLEKKFVVVNWDQPGSGKSFYAIKNKNLDVNTYIEDGYALTNYLCSTLKKDKIYLVGESWGSALGMFLANKCPEKYYAFIGTGQMVDFLETEKIDYEKAIEIAKEKKDTKIISKLKANGEPPYYGTDVTWKSEAYYNYLNKVMFSNPNMYKPGYNTIRDIFSPEYNIIDNFNYLAGLSITFNHIYPKLYNIDLRKAYKDIKIPVYFFLGSLDLNAPISLSEDYYKVLNATYKEIVWFHHSGHSPWINESDKFINEIEKISEKNNP